MNPSAFSPFVPIQNLCVSANLSTECIYVGNAFANAATGWRVSFHRGLEDVRNRFVEIRIAPPQVLRSRTDLVGRPLGVRYEFLRPCERRGEEWIESLHPWTRFVTGRGTAVQVFARAESTHLVIRRAFGGSVTPAPPMAHGVQLNLVLKDRSSLCNNPSVNIQGYYTGINEATLGGNTPCPLP